jgi:hypothetical protein
MVFGRKSGRLRWQTFPLFTGMLLLPASDGAGRSMHVVMLLFPSLFDGSNCRGIAQRIPSGILPVCNMLFLKGKNETGRDFARPVFYAE